MKTRQKSGFFDACLRALTALKSGGHPYFVHKLRKLNIFFNARVAESADAQDLKSLAFPHKTQSLAYNRRSIV